MSDLTSLLSPLYVPGITFNASEPYVTFHPSHNYRYPVRSESAIDACLKPKTLADVVKSFG